MVTIELLDKTKAFIKHGQWFCQNSSILKNLKVIDKTFLDNYSIDPDLEIAKIVCGVFDGKIIKTTGMPRYIRGRIY